MKNFIYLILMIILVTACNQSSGPVVQQLGYFTKQVAAPEAVTAVNLPATMHVTNWPNYQKNLAVNLNEKLSYQKVSLASFGISNINSQPIINNNKLYLIDRADNITSYNLANNFERGIAIKQKKNYKDISSFNPLTVTNNKIYSSNGRILNVYNLNGKLLASQKLPNIISSSIQVNDHHIAFNNIDDSVNLLDSNYNLLWAQNAQDTALAYDNKIHPYFYNDALLNFTAAGRVVSLDLKNGQVNWIRNLAELINIIPGLTINDITTQPILESNKLYIAGKDIYCLDVKTGASIWDFAADDVTILRKIGKHIFAVNNANQIYALNAENGKLNWLINLANEKKPYQLLNFSDVVMANNKLWAVTEKGLLFEIDAKTGKLLASHSVPKNIYKFLAYKDELYLLTTNKVLYKLK